MFLKIWCSSKEHLILCNCFHIFEKTPHAPCPFENSTVICWNTCPSPWRPFCLEKFLRVQVPLGCVKTAFVTQGLGSHEFVKTMDWKGVYSIQTNCNFGTATSYYLLNGFSRGIQVCVGGSLAFLIDDLTFYGRRHIFRVDRHPQCSGGFACRRSHPSLANRTGPNVEVVVARCRNCSSKLCWKCGQYGLRSLRQKAADQELQMNCNFGTATSYYLL